MPQLWMYRPGPACRVDALALAALVRDLSGTGALRDQKEVMGDWHWHQAKIRFGSGLDQDARPMVEEVFNEDHPTISWTREQPWDWQTTALSNLELSRGFTRDERPVYRAHLQLGQLREDLCERLDWLARDGANEYRVNFSDVMFQCEPVVYADRESGDHFGLGWCGLSVSGSGYFFPWKAVECIELARSIPEITAMFEVCRAHFPVKPAKPDQSLQNLRALLAKNGSWPYASVDQPLDWC